MTSKYQRYISDNLADAISKIDTFTAEHAKAVRHISNRIGRFTQQDVDTRVQMAYTIDQPMEIRGMTAFEVIFWYTTFNCYAQDESHFLNIESLYTICDQEHTAKYMRAVYVTKEPSETTYKELKAKHPQSAKAYLEYCKFIIALRTKNMDIASVFWPEVV